MNLLEPWILKDILERKEKEGLFILLESADMKVYPTTRDHEDNETFPRLLYRPETSNPTTMIVTATKRDENGEPNSENLPIQSVSYQELVDALKSYIKEKTPERWKQKETQIDT